MLFALAISHSKLVILCIISIVHIQESPLIDLIGNRFANKVCHCLIRTTKSAGINRLWIATVIWCYFYRFSRLFDSRYSYIVTSFMILMSQHGLFDLFIRRILKADKRSNGFTHSAPCVSRSSNDMRRDINAGKNDSTRKAHKIKAKRSLFEGE